MLGVRPVRTLLETGDCAQVHCPLLEPEPEPDPPEALRRLLKRPPIVGCTLLLLPRALPTGRLLKRLAGDRLPRLPVRGRLLERPLTERPLPTPPRPPVSPVRLPVLGVRPVRLPRVPALPRLLGRLTVPTPLEKLPRLRPLERPLELPSPVNEMPPAAPAPPPTPPERERLFGAVIGRAEIGRNDVGRVVVGTAGRGSAATNEPADTTVRMV